MMSAIEQIQGVVLDVLYYGDIFTDSHMNNILTLATAQNILNDAY